MKPRKDNPMEIAMAKSGLDRDARKSVRERERLGHGTATVERIAKAGRDGFEVTPASRMAPAGTQRVVEAPLDRLWFAGRISQREFEAGDKLRGLAYLAAVDPGALTVDWNSAGGGGRRSKVPAMFSSQDIADARLDFRKVEKAVSGIVWRVLNLGLIKELSLVGLGENVFGRHDPREAAVAGAAGFQVALGACADYFGM